MANKNDFQATFRVDGTLVQALRYGENPHQQGALYTTGEHRFGVLTSTQKQGKELSYNNILDADAAFECVAEFDPARTAAAVIIKHQTPCGAALGHNLVEAYTHAHACDPTAAYGGVIALNRPLGVELAKVISKTFVELVICPASTEEALEELARKPDVRLLITGGVPNPKEGNPLVRSIAGGFVVQTRDNVVVDGAERVVTKREPTEQELSDLRFAYAIAKHVKSNAIVYAKNGMTVGIGGGQVSRIDAARGGAMKAAESGREITGSVAASDAFFPFADGLNAIIETGATAVIQPGGSKRDAEVIQAANNAGIAMIFAGHRHFRH